jgi:hypothetical protein
MRVFAAGAAGVIGQQLLPGAKPPYRVPVWLGQLAAGEGGLHDDADPRLVERQGEAGTELAALVAELAAGIPARACAGRAGARRRPVVGERK